MVSLVSNDSVLERKIYFIFSQFGAWTRHTKGVGQKLMEKVV